MTEHMEGGCLCGASRYRVAGEPKFSIRCFCRDCQRATGGGHAPSLAVQRDAVTQSGPIKVHERKSASENDLRFLFCGECGSPLLKTTTFAPDLMFIYAGSLDYPETVTIDRNVYEDSRQPWDQG